MNEDEREDDELSLGDGRLDLEEEDVPGTEEMDAIPLTEAFNGDYQDVLLDADEAVIPPLSELINACWYSSALIVARQPVIDNQPLFDEWIRDHIGEDFDVVTISADLLMTSDELLEEVLEELGLASGDKGPGETLLAALNRREEGAQRHHPRELVVQVENAHELGERALQDLVALVADHETMITPHVILWWGDATTQDSLAEGGAVNVTRLDIPPFSRQAVVEYLTFCWGQYSAGALPLDEEQIDTIITASGGAADAMDRLALGELREEQAPAGERIGWLLPRGLPRRHAMIAGVLVLVLALSFFLRGDGDDSDAENTSIVRLERSLPEASEASPAVGTVSDSSETQASSGAGGNTAPSEPEEAAQEAAAAEPAPGTGEAVETAQTGPAEPESGLPPEETDQTAAADNTEGTSVGTLEADTARTALEQVADERFFIQLLGSHSIETTTRFMTDHAGLDGEDRALHRFEARYQGRPWHVVVHGPYQDRAAAEAAVDRLPRALRSASPWVRSMADIRSAMTR